MRFWYDKNQTTAASEEWVKKQLENLSVGGGGMPTDITSSDLDVGGEDYARTLAFKAGTVQSLQRADSALQPAALDNFYNKNASDLRFASAAQGTLAETAVQPETLSAELDNFYNKSASNSRYATAAQGALAESAVQPETLATELDNFYDKTVSDSRFAAAAQGALAESAVQPETLSAELDNYYTKGEVDALGAGYDDTALQNSIAALQTAKADKIVQQVQVPQTLFDYLHEPVPAILEFPAANGTEPYPRRIRRSYA
jgi:regulator of extracellular matrix RemA (YlzA/DUF370 family)